MASTRTTIRSACTRLCSEDDRPAKGRGDPLCMHEAVLYDLIIDPNVPGSKDYLEPLVAVMKKYPTMDIPSRLPIVGASVLSDKEKDDL